MSDQLDRRTNVATIATTDAQFVLDCGRVLREVVIAYETYGRLNRRRDNVILICHALTGSAHAAGANEDGRRGWWDGLIGPGKAIDTNRFFVICSNVLGGCYGSTGPTSIDPARGAPYGQTFPTITIRDIVRAQRWLLDSLGIERLHAVAGGSMGGMQVLEWALCYPDDVALLLPVATAARHAAWRIAFSSIARDAIALGRSINDEGAGLRLARKVAMLSYRSEHEFTLRFGRDGDPCDVFADDHRFTIERYLDHHGDALVERFDAATYETLLRAMDLHDVTRDRGNLEKTLGSIQQPTLCLGITSDILYPIGEQRELAQLIPSARYHEVESIYGHDAFLIESDQVGRVVRELLSDNINDESHDGRRRSSACAIPSPNSAQPKELRLPSSLPSTLPPTLTSTLS